MRLINIFYSVVLRINQGDMNKFQGIDVTFYKYVFASLFLLVSFENSALGLSTFRIYLDFDHREKSFIVYNKDAYSQRCQLSLRHFVYDEVGGMEPYEGEKLPALSAKKIIKFSPKKFRIDPGKAQAVRFMVRRKANVEAKEYRSYLSVTCIFDDEDVKNASSNEARIMPTLRHNVPIIVRTGDIPVEINFSDMSILKDTLTLNLNRLGQRSIYGHIEVVDIRNDKVIAHKNQVSMHIETKTKTFTFNIMNTPAESIKLRFIEDEALSGNNLIETKVL